MAKPPTRTRSPKAATGQASAEPRKPRARSKATRESETPQPGRDQAPEMSDTFAASDPQTDIPEATAVMDPPDVASTSMSSEPSEEDIRLRAYHRYLQRGGGHGLDFDDWLKAEQELKGRR
jgi:hypothetical protein